VRFGSIHGWPHQKVMTDRASCELNVPAGKIAMWKARWANFFSGIIEHLAPPAILTASDNRRKSQNPERSCTAGETGFVQSRLFMVGRVLNALAFGAASG